MQRGNGKLSKFQNVFITGGTGVLGAHLVKELLLSTRCKLFCLVRADSLENGKERLRSALRVYDPEGAVESEFQARVVPIQGDIVHETFGLPQEQYDDLTRNVDVTIHAAANTNLFASMRRIEPMNVGGTRNIIRFSLKTFQKYLCYVSTYTVLGDKIFDPSVVFKEKDLDIGQGFSHMTYQQTKFMAENLVRAASADGLIWNIFRPGQIFGESKSGNYPHGHASVGGLFYDIFKTIVETRVALQSRNLFDITPVDYVSRAILHLALERGVHFETYHLTNPEVKTWTEVVQMTKAMGYDIALVSQDEYRKMLFDKKFVVDGKEYKSVTTKAFKWWYLRQQFDFTESAVIDCAYTSEVLERASVRCPGVDKDLIRSYIEACVRRGYIPAPTVANAESRASSQRAGSKYV